MAKKLCMVFGCTGQDGSLISNSLLKQGYEVVGISRSKHPDNKFHRKLGIQKSFEIKQIGPCSDLLSYQNIIESYKPDEIYNLSAQSSVGLSFKDPYSSINSIYQLTLNILEACRSIEFEGKIFFAGSSEIFGETQGPADINHPRNALSPYAHAKEASMNLVLNYRRLYNLKCSTGVLFNHASSLKSDQYVIPKIVQGALKCKKDKHYKLNIGNIDVSRDWGWAPDYVEAMQTITRAKVQKDYVICTGKLTSLETFIDKVFNKLNLNWKDFVIQNKDLMRPTDIQCSFGNPKQLENELGWKNTKNIDDIINLMINS